MKPSDQIRRRQTVLYISTVAVVLTVVSVIAFFLVREPTEEYEPIVQAKVDVPSNSINPQELLNNKVEGEMDMLSSRFKVLEKFVLDSKEREEQILHENNQLKNEIEKLKKDLNEKEITKSLEKKIDTSIAESSFSLPFSSGSFIEEPYSEPRMGLVVKTADPKKNMIKNVNTTIPAGTTVKVLMVSSVDAPCGAYSSTDPQPIKLRILDDGHLPKCVRARLKGGIVIGSAYGDLSSERLFIRVERMTQMKSSGDFVETAVTGFITGEDGKYGVRGCVVDKSSQMVKNAALSGIISGANSFLSAYASRWTNCGIGCGPYYGGNCCDNECSTKDFTYGLAAQGGATGMENAFNTLTDYYIKKAEMINPVLQVSSGRIVDLTFSMSTEIGDLHARDRIEKVREEYRK